MSNKLSRIVSFIVSRGLRIAAPLPAVLFLGAFPLSTIAQDTIRTLDEVQVSTQRTPTTLQTAAPTQVLDAEQIEQQGALLLSDAVKQMAGVTLKDYGGVGGMKTVSARGLGSQFSTVTIDGIAISDAQNGQVDLGRYLLGNAAYVSMSQGHQQGNLLSARAYAAGNVLNLETAEPSFFLAERTNLKVGMELGSFGMLSPSVLWEQRWSRKLKSSVWANWLKSDGNYPYTLYYTNDRTGQRSQEQRSHSAMRMLTADANLFYTVAKGNNVTFKAHYMNGRHQLPGPVEYYYLPAKQNTREEVAFVQAKWRLERERLRTQVLGKWQYSYDRFEDSAASTRSRYQRNDYAQQEGYLSGSVEYDFLPWIELRGAADGSLSSLMTNLAQNNEVHRANVLAVAALRIHNGDSNFNRFELNANLLGTYVRDRVNTLDSLTRYRRLSPFVGLNITIAGHTTLRYFYKETFRVPNFSELYYFAQTRDLRPERARQHNVGITHANRWFSATVDGYFNRVTDKILAIPSQNMFLWSMENVGRVEILGLDASVEGRLQSVELRGVYSFQRAIDRTDPADPELGKTYGHQIAYTPRHSGGGSLRWENRWVNLGVSAMVVGERYYRRQNTPETLMPAYCDITLSADREWSLRWGTLRTQVQVLNLLNVQYEVVRSYPMMGRNYRVKLIYSF